MRTTVKIPDQLDARLRHEAARRGVTIADLSREALEAYLGESSGRRRLGAAGDWPRIAELAARYRDLLLGTVDASVVVTAERLGVAETATVDRRHFTGVRPAHVDAFTLVP